MPVNTSLRSITSFSPDSGILALFGSKGLVYVGTLSGTLALTDQYPTITKFDPDGSSRDVTLEAVGTSEGKLRWIINGADGAENLVVKNAGGSTIGTVNQNESGIFYCDGATWILVSIIAIALS